MTTQSPIRMLVVDDDPEMLRLLEAYLAHGVANRIQIKTLSDPKAARRHLETEIVDLLITDLEMPGISGLELLRCAKRRNAWTQVLLVTGHSSLDALTEAMEHGASDYLLKPLDPRELDDVVAGVLNRLSRWRKALAGTFVLANNRQAAIA